MTTIDSEIQRFNRLGATWWNPEGPMRPLQRIARGCQDTRVNYMAVFERAQR